MTHYLDIVGAEIGHLCGLDTREPHERRLLRIYALLCLVVGEQTSAENVHDAWSIDCRDDHPCAIPFSQLSADKQALDIPYRDAIRQVACRRMTPAPAASIPAGYSIDDWDGIQSAIDDAMGTGRPRDEEGE